MSPGGADILKSVIPSTGLCLGDGSTTLVEMALSKAAPVRGGYLGEDGRGVEKKIKAQMKESH